MPTREETAEWEAMKVQAEWDQVCDTVPIPAPAELDESGA